jgi:hypothetical protein
MPIPSLLENGCLPVGVYKTDIAEIEERFGKSTPRRREIF